MNNNTKIAICMSGHIRTLSHTFEKNFDLIKRMNPNSTFEIYCAFWEKEYGRVNVINDPWHLAVDIDENVFDSTTLEKYLTKFSNQSIVNVKLYDINSQKKCIEAGEKLAGLLSQYFLIQESFNLAKSSNANHYIRIRPDIVIKSFPDLSSTSSELITSQFVWYNLLAGSCHLENEMVWVASSSIASNVFSIFDAIKDRNLLNGIEIYGESITGKHFSNISTERDHFDFEYRVAR